jgi:uncharacterized membrane protein
MASHSIISTFAAVTSHFSFPSDPVTNEEMALRWIHLVAGIIWIGLLYFFNLVATPTMKQLDAPVHVAFALIYPFQLPHTGALDNAWVRSIAIAVVVIAASWTTLALNSGAESSNAHLSIAIGGGIGLVLLLNVWGIVWRAQKRLIAWTRASAEEGAAMPAEAARLARWAFLASRAGFWLSFPMLFFMGAAAHYPFLSGIVGG